MNSGETHRICNKNVRKWGRDSENYVVRQLKHKKKVEWTKRFFLLLLYWCSTSKHFARIEVWETRRSRPSLPPLRNREFIFYRPESKQGAGGRLKLVLVHQVRDRISRVVAPCEERNLRGWEGSLRNCAARRRRCPNPNPLAHFTRTSMISTPGRLTYPNRLLQCSRRAECS